MNPLFVTVASWITYRTSGVDDVICEPESLERRPAAGACDRAELFRKRDESMPRGMAQRAAAGGLGVVRRTRRDRSDLNGRSRLSGA